jgi:hypothetical protein
VVATALLALVGCRPGREASSPKPRRPKVVYDDSAISPRARVLLVAGGDDVANFAAEVVEQRRLWRDAGLSDDQIECYFAGPTKQGWDEDFEQYQEILPALQGCHRASPQRVLSDLTALASHEPDWVYLYVSAHGVESLLELAESSSNRRMQKILASLDATERRTLDAAAIGLQAGPSPRLGQVSRVIEGMRSGRPHRELVFSPATLREALGSLPETTKKVVVLQACYSGGFIGHPPSAGNDPQPLADVRNLVAMTATSAHSPSFGCDAGSYFTYFGGAFGRSLARQLATHQGAPADLDWEAIFERTEFAVESMEAIANEDPSRPGFFSTTPD